MSERPVEAAYPLSPVQEGILFHSLYAPEEGLYVVQLSCDLRGELDADAFERAWQAVVDRHAILRTGFTWKSGARPLQVVGRRVGVPVRVEDWRGIPAPEWEARFAAFLAEDRVRGFKLNRAPLLRVALLRTGEREHRFVWTFHHLLLDGWSYALVLAEVFQVYQALRRSAEPRLGPVRPYRAFIDWLQARDRTADEAFWRERLRGIEDAERTVPGTTAGPAFLAREAELTPAATADLERAARRHRMTMSTLVQGALALWLGRSTGRGEVVFGAVASGRPPELAGVESIVGMFVNTLPVRVPVSGEARVGDWLEALQGQQAELRLHENSGLVDLQAWSGLPAGEPLFEAVVIFENYPVSSALDPSALGLEVGTLHSEIRSNYPLNLAVTPGERLKLRVSCSGARFDAPAADRMLGHLERLLAGLAADPEKPLASLAILSEAERHQLLWEWDDTASEIKAGTVVDRFLAQAARTPDAEAVVPLTYKELARRSGELACHLSGLGVGPEVRVGLCLERTPDLAVALLGIWRAGGAYVPLDPSYPDARLALLLEDSGAAVVVTEERWRDRLTGVRRVCMESLGEERGPERRPAPADLAYLIYTSGTTGRPKAVMVEHGSLANLLDGREVVGRMPCLAAYTFDIFLFELLSPLLAGGASVLYGHRPTLDVEAVAADLAEMTHLHAVPAVMRQIVERAGEAPRLRELYVGGDLVPSDLLAAMRERFPAARVRVLYGPTEATILATSSADGPGAVIGRPLKNVRLRLTDRSGSPVPIGMAGEIRIGGPGVSRGYLGQEELTRERFVEADGGRWYRTGDLGRWLADGRVEFLGRSDDQVKVRGFRIELGEVESAIARHPGVRAAAAAVRSGRLVGWFVPAGPADDLRSFLESQLPAPLVPSALVELADLPLTPHGKVDRRALPDPERTGPAEPVAPRTPVEEVLAGIWAGLLGQERVGVHDSFFELGGHSLLATQLVSRIREVFEVELPLARLFEAPTVAELAAVVMAQKEIPAAPPLEAVDREADLPLSFAQERIWFFEQLEPGTPTYNLPLALRLDGEVDPAALAGVFGAIVERHEALRTAFVNRDGEPRQRVEPPASPAEWHVPVVDGELESLAEIAAEEARRPFDLGRGPLLRTTLVRLGEREHVLLLTLHHIAADAWSMGVLVEEVGKLWSGEALRPLPVQYGDYAVWQRGWLQGEALERLVAYWRGHLAGAPTLLELPTDRPRPAVQSFRGAACTLELGERLSEGLRALARGRNATLFMVLLAGYETLLGRLSDREDVVVGTPIAGRPRRELEGLIGFFVNTLALRGDLSGDPTFGELVGRARRAALAGYEHQDLPFEKLVEALQPERSLGHAPLFQAMLVLQNAPLGAIEVPGVSLRAERAGTVAAEHDWTLEAWDVEGRIRASLQYRTDLFDEATIRRALDHLETLLEAAVEEPRRKIGDLPLLRPVERQQILCEWGEGGAAGSGEVPVHERIAALAAERPGAPAVIFVDGVLSFEDLAQRSRRLALELNGLGVGPESVVALFVERSPEMAVGILGVLAAGGAYLPLDPGYPKDRLAFLLEDSGAGVVLTQRRLLGALPADGPALLCLDEERPAPVPAVLPAVLPDQAAYVIYTSGSTGKPKGAIVSHRALSVYTEMFSRELELGPDDRMLQFASPAFDVVVEELFPAWSSGAAVVLRAPEALSTGEGLRRVLAEDGVTVCELPTAFWHEWVYELSRTGAPLPESLRLVLIGGEHVLPERLAAWGRLGVPLVHVYGLTETTVTSTTWPVPAGWTPPSEGFVLPIGRPLPGTRVLVLDRGLQPVPAGVAGELYLGGSGLARGYVGRPDLTAERFVPFESSRLYRTGDLARWRPDGTLEFLGRLDHQVKVRGFRVEPGEIEAVLARHPAVREVSVVARSGRDGTRRLVAYVALAQDTDEGALVQDLRQYARGPLPDYMVPSAFVVLPALPRTATGKLDRRALPEPAESAGAGGVQPRTATEEILAGLWSEVLGLERVGIQEDFFALGGHSLLATRVVSRLRETFGVELPLRALFEHPTVESLAAAVDAALRSGLRTEMPALVAVSRTGAIPLSFAQQRLWFLDQLDPGNPAYNVPVALRLRGDLNVADLARTLSEIARRHEVLRTRFAVEDGRAVAVVEPFTPVPLPVVDLSGVARRETVAADLVKQEAVRRFDLERGPLMRACLVRLGPDDHLALFSTHHIVSDAWSMDVLVREVASLYGGSTLPDLPVQYADYAAWQRSWLQGETLEAHLAWWRARLAGASPVLDLPTDRPRPAVQSFRGASHAFDLPDLAWPLRAFARREGVTLFMALLAAFQALLHRVTGQDDLSLGTPVAGREHLRTEDLIGFFVNTLVLRAGIDPEASVLALLRETRENVLEAFVHQDLPLDLLVEALRPERDLSWQPLFQAVFAFEPGVAKAPALPGLALEPLAIPGGAAKFDLSLTVVDDGVLRAAFVYAAELFDATTLARLGSHFAAVVRGLVESPSTPVAALALLSEPERHQLLQEWSDTASEVEPGTVVDRLLAQAERTPDAEAVAPLTYGELARRSGDLARHLSGLGVGPEVRVGLCLERTPELMVALLGIWRAGGAYVPLDPSYPDARLALLLEDSGAAVVVTEERWRDRLTGVRQVCMESLGEERGPERRPSSVDLAYLIYTSGTTGRPKAVMVEHGSLANLLDGGDFRAGDRMPCLAAYTFDIFLFELLSPLLAGGASVLYGLTPTLDVDAVAADLAEMTHLHAVPAVMRQIVDRAGEAPRLRELYVGGDVVPTDLLAAMRERFPAARVRVLYGPTEATILATSSAAGPGPVIGRPLANVRLRLSDKAGAAVPIGVAGEIWIGGAGVSRGYLGQEELTRERFVEAGGERWYRTGDLGRWLPDGTVEFLGRSDDQVKVRGFRIELGEVESAMARHPGVRAAAAAVRSGRLVGWFVPAGEVGDLRAFLESQLPAPLVPSALVELESLPLTPHGKVDRRALPDPERTATEAVAPRNQVEEILAGIWSDLLGQDRVGVHDSFFDLGGHSLLATQLVSRVREAFAVELPLARLFEAPTIAGLAAAVAAQQGVAAAPPLETVDRRGDLPLSFAQERIWFFEQLEPGTPTYHLPLALRLEGEVDAAALARIFGAIAERHEALRTVFVNPGGEPRQRIEPPAIWQLPVVDGNLAALAAEEARRPFDLGRGPLLRTTLVRLGEREHVLLLTLHHIASDAWSMGVLVEEVQRLWSGEALPPLPVQYGDYAVWQRSWLQGEALERLVAYWRGHLAGAPALLELPADRPRPAVQSFQGAACTLELGEQVSEGLRALARGRSATLFMVLLAGFEALLGRLSGQEDLVVGTPIASRTRRELEALIGFFVNTLALRGDLSGDPTFGELVGRARRAALAGYEHQDLPFEKLVEELQPERSLGHAPLFQAMFVLQNAPLGPVEVPGVRLRAERTGTVAAEHDWTLETWDVDGRIRASLQYRTDLFDEATVRRALGHLETLLEAAVQEPRRKVWDLPLLRPMERQQIVSEWGDGGAAGSGEVPVHERIAALAAERPEAPAVVFADGALSFGELMARSRRLALELAGLGIGPESVVALCVERSPEMAIGILGALAAGGAYLPLDPSYPRERLAFLLEDSGAGVVLTQHRLLGALPSDGPAILCLDGERPAPVSAVLPSVLPDQSAYVIYTSGSTGLPKGAVVSHRALSVYTETLSREMGLGPDDRMLQFASPAFDVVVEELFPAWSSGAAVVLRESEALSTGAGLRQVLAEDGVTVCELPTAFWHEWVYELARTGESLPESLRLVLIGGEHVLPERLSAWSRFDVPLVHVYGLTETTVTSTTWSVPAGWAPPSGDFVLPIGRPLPGTRVLVLDRNLQPVPAGVAGELCLGGSGLARGYVGRPDLTAERFVPSEGSRLYRTGDLARWRADGALEFLGRLDQQVKVRGFRVEPGEIEAVLARHPAVREVSVVARAQRLIAYVVLGDGGDGGVEDLRRHLQGSLPDYMVPSAFVLLPALPRTATGKLDRRALPEPAESTSPGDEKPRTATEEILAGLWSEVLGLERVGTREDFFALGGHSLLGTRLISRLRETFGVELPLRSLFEHPTVESLAAAVDASLRSGLRTEMPPLSPIPRTEALPLSFAQQRLWFLDQLDPGNPAYNVPVALRLRGGLDVAVLARTLSEISRRHEVLRTRFAAEDGRAVAIIEPFAPVPLPVVDLSGAEDREALASRLAVEEAERRFDLERGPLMRACLVRLGADDHLALFSTHHIVSDAWSMDVLVKEVASLYTGSALPDLPVQYADYAAWQRSWLQGEVLEEHLAWWRARLAGASPVLDLPTDRPRPPVQSFRGATHAFAIPDDLAAGLRDLGRREGTTLFMTLLAGFESLLLRHSLQEDFCVGTPIAGRSLLAVEDLIGFFVNTLVLRADLADCSSFRDLLRRCREAALGAFSHAEMPLDRLVEELQPERRADNQPLFQVMFAFETEQEQVLLLPGLTFSPVEVHESRAKFDLTLTFSEARGALGAGFSFACDLFDATTVARMGERLVTLLRVLAASPDEAFRTVSLLGEAERHQVLAEWNDTAFASGGGTVVERFAAQAARTPDAPAVEAGGSVLSYGDLARRSGDLARHLRALGVGPETRVGLCLDRTADLVVGLLGIWKAGGAYVAMEPSYPDARLALLLEDSAAPVVVTERRWRDRLAAMTQVPLVCADEVEAIGAIEGAEASPDPRDLAYLIYTSGTTGRPKAVMVEHGSLANLLEHTGRVFGFGPGDRMPCLAAYTFDIFLFELLSPLLAGGTSVIYGLRPTLDVESVAAGLPEMTHLHAVPAVMRQIVDLAGEAPRLRELFVGGDLVPPDLLAAMRERFPAARVHVLYGPTEGTILASSHAAEIIGQRPVIGRPLGNMVLRLVDKAGEPAPIGIAGEIWIGGAGVSRGYLGQEELTREKFVEAGGERWYRTGDFARWLADGGIEFLGRSDDQVKIRGFRIELAEVESVLARHPAVRAAAAAARGEGEARRLVGWFVPVEGAAASAVSAAVLREFLEERLPAHMVPSALVELETLPLTPHGKVDRRALPDPERTDEEAGVYVPPRTPTEELLAGIWAEVLKQGRVGVHDNFFDLGGHSLLATQLISRVREAFEVELPLVRIFEAPTVAGLAEVLATGSSSADKAKSDPILPAPRDRALPLSFSQERVWFFEQLEPGTSAYNLPLALRIEGDLTPALLSALLEAIARRHEPLRTSFPERNGEPVQEIAPPGEWLVPVIDLTGLENRFEVALAIGTREAQRPFELAAGPLLRTRLLKLGPDDQILLFNMHHIVSDGWSMGVLMSEFSELYRAYRTGLPPELPALPVQYADYSVWQREWMKGEVLERQLGFWREQLEGAPAILDLPTDRPRPAFMSFRGGTEYFRLDSGRMAALHALARRRGTTMFMVLLAAFDALVGRHTASGDVVVGSPIANRTRSEVENLIGFFVNTILLRVSVAGDPTFIEILDRVRRATLAAYGHQDLPFEKLVEALQPDRNLGETPLFQIMFVLQNAPAGAAGAEDLKITPIETPGEVAAEFDWTVELVDASEGLLASLQYRRDLFDQTTIQRVARRFEVLLDSLSADPERYLSDLLLLTPAERHQLAAEWNDTEQDEPETLLVWERIASWADRLPDAPAVISGSSAGGSLSYRELVERAERLAAELRALGVGPEVVVALFLERSPETAVGILGVLAAGGVYVPLDPAYPRDRITFMLEDSGARVVLTQRRLLDAIPADGLTVLCLDEEREAPVAGEPVRVDPVHPENAAYIIYTSGSTGRPKGAVITHRALAVYVEAISRELGLGPQDRMLQFASPGFDVVVEEIFPAWANGAAVVLRESEAFATGEGLLRVIADDGVTACELPTAFWHEWVYELARTGRDLPESLRFVIIGGEHVIPERLAAWSRFGVPLVHVYGLTETTVTSTTWHVPAGWAPPSEDFVLPIGRPIGACRVLIPAPLGVPGELCIAGDCLARGYFGRPDLTAERFTPGPLGERIYRTGDLARYRADGAIEFLGRLDHQVKIRGFRIELGEIEAALGRHPAVREVAVLARKGPDGMPRLVAYLALGAQIGAAELRPYLQELLPEYMIPGVFVPLEALPRTATGKVDRKALPEVELQSERAYVAPRDPTEELLAVLWTQVLGVERVGVEDDFFSLGGHSLLATRLMARVREAFGVDVPLRSLFESPSLAGLAQEVRTIQRSGSGLAMPPIEPAGRSEPLPLSFAQQRLWFLGQLEPDNPAYNVPIALRVTGDLDVRVFDRTLGEIVRRHESLRTRFGMDGADPVQVIDPSSPWHTPVIDLGALPSEVREREVFRLATDEAQTPFDLARGPLLRVRLLALAPGERVVLFSMHHIVSDAWSMEVLVGEMAPLYSAFLRREPSPLPELPIQYADYAVWQRRWLQGEVLEKHLAYWKEQLAGAAQILELPTDRPRPSFQTFRGATYSFDLPPALAQALRAVAREESATLFMTLLAPLEWLLSRYSGQQDFCVGTPIAGRNHLETEGLIGFFVNTLVLRADLSRAAGPRDLLRRGREVVLGAFSHQDLPFEKLVEEIQPERDLARHPLFQAVFALETERGEEPEVAPISDGLAFAPLEFEGTAAKFDWALSVVDFGERLSIGIDYMADLFDETTIARMAAHYERLATALAEEPWRALDETPLLAASELQQVVREWSDTDLSIDAEATVPALFAQAARRWPEADAVSFDGESITYAELDARSDRLARRLAGLGVGPETVVGLGLDRSLDLVAGLLGIWKAGGAFVPMDPGYPDLRLQFLAEDSGAAFVVTREAWRERLEGLGAKVVGLDEAGDEAEPRTARPGDLAYLIYTSGTTGTPKAVLVEHRSLVNVLGSAQRRFDFRPGDRMPCLASFSFDIFLFELLNSLLAGGTSVLFGLDPTLDVDRVAASLVGMTHLHAVPAVMRRLVESARSSSLEAPGLREIFVGGDLVPPDLLAELREVFPAARTHVLYGPTEATIICSSHRASPEEDRPWIGRPLPNARLFLVGRGGLLVPVGAVGEIWIGGPGVARGYQNREELTAEKFATWDDGERFYRTGDLGRWSADGVLEFLGRLDDQVKVRGFRIEPGEIEAALRQSPQVQDAAVAVWGEGEDRRLAAYFVPAEGADIPTPDELRDFLRKSLPEHMIPAAFLELPAIPLTPHGKVDRRHLPEPEGFGAVEYVAPKEGIEEILAGIWAELLDVPRVGARDNFFDLGGHSLLATRLASRVREAFGVELPLRAIFENPTVAELAGPVEELVLADIDALSEDEARALLES